MAQRLDEGTTRRLNPVIDDINSAFEKCFRTHRRDAERLVDFCTNAVRAIAYFLRRTNSMIDGRSQEYAMEGLAKLEEILRQVVRYLEARSAMGVAVAALSCVINNDSEGGCDLTASGLRNSLIDVAIHNYIEPVAKWIEEVSDPI